MNCLLTGGTGIVGSHIMFEWLHKAIVEKTVNHLFVITRDNKKTAQQRITDILQNTSRPEFLNAFSLETCLEKITVIYLNSLKITSQNLNGITTNLNLDLSSKLSAGLYFIDISTENASTIKKLIIE